MHAPPGDATDLPPSPPPSPPPPTPDRPICPNQSIWSSLDHTALKRLISEQIPRFAQRPYLQGDSSSIRAALEEDLDFDGDYCWALSLEPAFVRALCHEGFLPICSELGGGTGLFALLPKLHAQRCVLHFSSLHVPRKVRRRAVRHGYTLTAGDHAFDEVVGGCLRQHGSASWLHPPLRVAFTAMRKQDREKAASGSAGGGEGDARLCCFALWSPEGKLVAGEFGVIVGSVYTSFTGFYEVDGAGAIQMALTAKLLEKAGFAFWDMGQEHAYKSTQGAVTMQRRAFLTAFRERRSKGTTLSKMKTRWEAAELLQPPKAEAEAPIVDLSSC